MIGRLRGVAGWMVRWSLLLGVAWVLAEVNPAWVLALRGLLVLAGLGLVVRFVRWRRRGAAEMAEFDRMARAGSARVPAAGSPGWPAEVAAAVAAAEAAAAEAEEVLDAVA